MIRVFSKIWIIGILAAVAAGGIFAWQYWAPELAPIYKKADWQIYRNEVYGFEIKYPTDWEVEVDYAKAVTNIMFNGGSEGGYNMQIYQDVNSDIYKFANDLFPNATKLNITDIDFNKYKGVLVTKSSPYPEGTYILLHNNSAFVFPVPAPLPFGLEQKIINSTFEFVETNETSGWQIYRNDIFGFEIKYPKNSQCKLTETGEGSFFFGRIELNVTDSEGLDLVDYVDNFIQNSDWTIERKENTIIDDTASVKVTYRFGGTNRYGEANFIGGNGNIYTIGYTVGGFTCDEPQIFSRMLSTIRFIEVPASDNIIKCGSVNLKILTQYDYQPTASEKEAAIKSLACINQAIIKCSPALLAISNVNETTNIAVKGRGKLGCEIGIQKFTGEITMCPLPSDYVADLQKKFVVSNYDATIVTDLITDINAEISSGNQSGNCTITK